MTVITDKIMADAIASRDPDALIAVITELRKRMSKPVSRLPRVEAAWRLKKTVAEMTQQSFGCLSDWDISMDNRDPDNIKVKFRTPQGDACADYGPYTISYYHQGDDDFEPRSVYYPSGGRWIDFSSHVDEIRAIARYVIEKFTSCPEFSTSNALDYDGDALPYPSEYAEACTKYQNAFQERMRPNRSGT